MKQFLFNTITAALLLSAGIMFIYWMKRVQTTYVLECVEYTTDEQGCVVERTYYEGEFQTRGYAEFRKSKLILSQGEEYYAPDSMRVTIKTFE